MNKYPAWWNQAITVYNKSLDPQTKVVTWYKTVILDCFWKAAGNKVTINDTTIDTNNIVCRIRKNENYRTPLEWFKLTNDEKANYFTLKQGDIIIGDLVEDDINEYLNGHRSTDILKKYQALQLAMTIQNVSNNTGVGKGNEHYYISGE